MTNQHKTITLSQATVQTYEQVRVNELIGMMVYRVMPIAPDRPFNREVTARAIVQRVERELQTGWRLLP
jgi:hypothetical protein